MPWVPQVVDLNSNDPNGSSLVVGLRYVYVCLDHDSERVFKDAISSAVHTATKEPEVILVCLLSSA